VIAGLWTAFLVNFLFWTGTAAGSMAFAALLDVTGAQWAAPLRATAIRFHRFLPISVALYIVLLIGARDVYPWIAHPIDAPWLRFWPFVIRDLAALGAVAATAAWFGSRPVGTTQATMVFLITYAVAFSILAIDLVMSLAAPWGSTLFPAYLFIGNVYAAIAAVALVTAWRSRDRDQALTDDRVADLAKILLGFSLLWMYLVWSQFLVIWYGNVSDEVRYLMPLLYGRWQRLTWTIWTARFALPFLVLLPRIGRRRTPVLVAASIVAAGFWAECLLLVTPAASGLPSAWTALAVTAAFFALFGAVTATRPVRARHLRNAP
jgi:hypothetical protein